MTDHGDTTTVRGAQGYVNDLARALARLDLKLLDDAIEMVASRIREGRGVFVVGNGGSSSVAEHMACDWQAAAWQAGHGPREISSLTENTARITAIANDYSYEAIFEQQLVERCHAGDLLVCLSVSGTSVNVLRAASSARERGVAVLSLVGRPSPVSELSDLAVHLDIYGDYGLTEDLQSLFTHMVARDVRKVGAHRVPPSAQGFRR
ncbi:SIS domain-containing protein [Streptomyces sp. NPDC086182]|jgi:phosphoheptose isomerase|uniref:D-sedoheptulose-7-phosphate isomerase n=1 Tax=Streptomyces sp. NPDC086182 TaxID=3155058 RepID=UPI00344702F5